MTTETAPSAEVVQFGHRMPVDATGTHVRPTPTPFGLGNPISYTAECDPEPLPQVFTVTTPLLDRGRSDRALAFTDRLQVAVKCYASGGENYLHTHTEEDHAFVVLQGRATFVGPDGVIAVVGPNEGVLVPRGAFYAFRSSGDEPLVLLRAGAPWPGNRMIAREGHDRRIDPRDHAFPDPVAIPGEHYR